MSATPPRICSTPVSDGRSRGGRDCPGQRTCFLSMLLNNNLDTRHPRSPASDNTALHHPHCLLSQFRDMALHRDPAALRHVVDFLQPQMLAGRELPSEPLSPDPFSSPLPATNELLNSNNLQGWRDVTKFPPVHNRWSTSETQTQTATPTARGVEQVGYYDATPSSIRSFENHAANNCISIQASAPSTKAASCSNHMPACSTSATPLIESSFFCTLTYARRRSDVNQVTMGSQWSFEQQLLQQHNMQTSTCQSPLSRRRLLCLATSLCLPLAILSRLRHSSLDSRYSVCRRRLVSCLIKRVRPPSRRRR
ncbi:hypothetical protein BDQ17DRAFT_410761 [Cyathus striatus]|nr:hypothetical protein BDQ17DRAFT_410761 [Cyathus striatus]